MSMYEQELYHHGILGMHWGVRRYQPYPKGYSGDGKEVGEAAKANKLSKRQQKLLDEQPLTKKEIRERNARKQSRRAKIFLGAYATAAVLPIAKRMIKAVRQNRDAEADLALWRLMDPKLKARDLPEIQFKDLNEEFLGGLGESFWTQTAAVLGTAVAFKVSDAVQKTAGKSRERKRAKLLAKISGDSSESEVKHSFSMYEQELYHHGVLGMHWGVRRYQPYSKGYSGDGKEVGEARKVEQRSDSNSAYEAERRRRRNSNIRKAITGAAVVGAAVPLAIAAKKVHDANKKYAGKLNNERASNELRDWFRRYYLYGGSGSIVTRTGNVRQQTDAAMKKVLDSWADEHKYGVSRALEEGVTKAGKNAVGIVLGSYGTWGVSKFIKNSYSKKKGGNRNGKHV